ncbi:MAG: LytR C-terminal domain-containing protein [Coriobacteriia bacterium]|nr:LytR C-terminal domain-containing protein [Coriobacteriia bacterium]
MASDAGRRLRNLDFRIGEIGNMNQMVYDETLIVYKKNKDRATLVSEALGKGKVVTSRGMYSFDTDVLVVVGKDWGPPVTSHDNQIPID